MLSWLLVYTSLFDVRKTPQVDINDPGGIVLSQVVETSDGSLRMVLNASQSPRTQSRACSTRPWPHARRARSA